MIFATFVYLGLSVNSMIETMFHNDRDMINYQWFKSYYSWCYVLTDCKEGFIHSFAWFEIQGKKMCIHCLTDEWKLKQNSPSGILENAIQCTWFSSVIDSLANRYIVGIPLQCPSLPYLRRVRKQSETIIMMWIPHIWVCSIFTICTAFSCIWSIWIIFTYVSVDSLNFGEFYNLLPFM